jgi:hypothetical protein
MEDPGGEVLVALDPFRPPEDPAPFIEDEDPALVSGQAMFLACERVEHVEAEFIDKPLMNGRIDLQPSLPSLYGAISISTDISGILCKNFVNKRF